MSQFDFARDTRYLSPKNGALALAIGVLFICLASVCIAVTRFEEPIATIWIPNAVIAALLLHSGHDKVNPLIVPAIFIGSFIVNRAFDFPLHHAALFALGNAIEIIIAVKLTRHLCRGRPNIEQLAHLGYFALAGGLLACSVSGFIAMIAIGMGESLALEGWLSWYLSDAMGMIILVPLILLMFDARNSAKEINSRERWEQIGLIALGGAITAILFYQSSYQLMFLITPIVLVHAFRTGALGSATFVMVVAAIATAMTWLGYGPVAISMKSPEEKLFVLQAFMAANFLTGVPVASILSGREAIKLQLEDNQRQLALLAGNVSDAIFHYNLEGICTYVSPSAKDVLGADPSELLGRRPSDRVHPESREAISRVQHNLLNGLSQQERFTYRRYLDDERGMPVYLEANCSLVCDPDSGKPASIIIASRDITERVELEKLLRGAREEAEEAVRTKSEFLANMSHEIRTPMNGVLGFAELMLHNRLEPEQRRQVELIVQSGRSMMMLLNDILDLSKIEAGQIEIDLQAVSLTQLLSECAQLHRATAAKKGLEIRLDGLDMPVQIMSDGQRLRQILLNLIGNAVKFTDQGHVSIGCVIDDDLVRITVKDTGIGVDSERLERIFRPFAQADSDTSRRYGGTGLGLSISHQLATLLDGYIDVDSELGIGSCFTLTIPFVEAEGESLVDDAPLVEREPVETQQALHPGLLPATSHILLVEDHDINRLLVSTMLQRCGQRVSCAVDGNEAIAKVLEAQLHGEPFDLVLMDIQMPECDGYKATRTIREEGIRPEVLPILALSANAFPDDIAASRKAGMQAHIAKPIVLSTLVKNLQRWLPVRIVEEGEAEFSEDGPTRFPIDDPTPHDCLSKRDQLAVDFGQALNCPDHVPSPALQIQWQHRRREAIDAIGKALRAGELTGSDGDALAGLVHKLAGTAGMFGERELGERAAAFERALRSGVDLDVREQLARHLLDAA